MALLWEVDMHYQNVEAKKVDKTKFILGAGKLTNRTKLKHPKTIFFRKGVRYSHICLSFFLQHQFFKNAYGKDITFLDHF